MSQAKIYVHDKPALHYYMGYTVLPENQQHPEDGQLVHHRIAIHSTCMGGGNEFLVCFFEVRT